MKHKKEIFLLKLVIWSNGLVLLGTCVYVFISLNVATICAEVFVIWPGYYFLVKYIKTYIKELQDDEESRFEPK